MRNLLAELVDPETTDSSSVEFEEDRSGNVTARFRTEDGPFRVTFTKKILPWMGRNQRLIGSYSASEIGFFGPTGETKVTGSSKNPGEVYNKLMQAVHGYTVRYKPEMLSFMPSDPNMNAIYKRFYDKYLSRRYKIMHYLPMQNNTGFGYFLRNDLYEQIKDSVESDRHVLAWDADVKASSERKRERRRMIASGAPMPREPEEPSKLPGFREWVSCRSTLD